MKSVNRLLALVLALATTITLAGCQTDSNASKPAEPTSSAPANSAAAPTGEPVQLVFWDMAWAGEAYYNQMQKLIAQFEQENPGITIEYQSIPWDGYVQNFTTAVVSGSGPDFATGGSSMQHLFAKMDEILLLDSIVEEWEQTGELADFIPGTLENIRYDGHQIGIPWNYDPMMVWYNKEHFAKAGIDKLPASNEELYDALVKLRDAGLPGIVTDGTFHYKVLTLWQMFAWNYGEGGLIKDGEIIVDSDASKQAFQLFRTMVKEELMPMDVAGWNDPDAIKQFLQGNASIVFNNINVQRITKESAPDMLEKIAILPAFASGTANPANSIMGFKQTKHPEETKKAIAWFSKNEGSLFTESDLTQIPVRISIANQEAVLNRGNVRFIVESVLPSGKGNGYPSAALYPQFQTIMSDGIITNAVHRAMLTDDSIDKIAADARAEIEKIMAT